MSYSLSTYLSPEDPNFQSLAENTAQETLLRVLDKLETFEGRSRFTTWVHKIAICLKLDRVHTNGQPPPPQAQEVLQAMLRKLALTQEIELTCGEVFDLLDQYSEMVANGEEEGAAKIMPLVKQHLEMCPDCREEFEALLKVLQNAPAL